MTSPNPTFLSFVGLAKETTVGTPVAATSFIPVHNAKPKDLQKYLEDKGWRGSQTEDYGQVAGSYHAEYDFDGDVFPDTVGFPIVGVLGDAAVVGASPPYTTTASLLNSGKGQPPTYTISDFDGNQTRQFPGFTFSEFAMKFNADNMLTYSAKGLALPPINGVSKPTASYSALPPLAAWTGVCTLGGSVANTVLDGDISIKRKLTVIDTVDNSNAPRNIWGGPVSCEGKMNLVVVDTAPLLSYLNNSQPSLDITYAGGAGAGAFSLGFHMTKAAYTAVELDRGKDYTAWQVTFKGVANATDAGASGGVSPVKVTMQNAIVSGTYK